MPVRGVGGDEQQIRLGEQLVRRERAGLERRRRRRGKLPQEWREHRHGDALVDADAKHDSTPTHRLEVGTERADARADLLAVDEDPFAGRG
jgi:hypothetical protein